MLPPWTFGYQATPTQRMKCHRRERVLPRVPVAKAPVRQEVARWKQMAGMAANPPDFSLPFKLQRHEKVSQPGYDFFEYPSHCMAVPRDGFFYANPAGSDRIPSGKG